MILTKIEVPECVPDNVRAPLSLLTGEALDLSSDWKLFNGLFVDAAENIELINKTAPMFFQRIQSLLYESLLIGVSRFTDRQSMRNGNQNLVLDDLFTDEKPSQLKELEETTQNIRKIRHKVVGHLDREYGFNPSLLPDKNVISEIKKSVELIEKIIDEAWQKWASENNFIATFCFTGPSETIEILNCLQKAHIYDRLENEKIVPEIFWNYPEDMVENYFKNNSVQKLKSPKG